MLLGGGGADDEVGRSPSSSFPKRNILCCSKERVVDDGQWRPRVPTPVVRVTLICWLLMLLMGPLSGCADATEHPVASRSVRATTTADLTSTAAAAVATARTRSADDGHCAPQAMGWSPVPNHTLRGIGYHAAVVTVGRHLLVLGGVAQLKGPVDVYTYVKHHTQRAMNMVHLSTYAVTVPERALRNKTSTRCAVGPNELNWSTSMDIADDKRHCSLMPRGEASASPGLATAGPPPTHCIEPPQHTLNASTAAAASDAAGNDAGTSHPASPAELLVPVVGSGSVVRVNGAVYAFGACNTIPHLVDASILLRTPYRGRARRASEAGSAPNASFEVNEADTSSPQASLIEDYLRSVLRIRFYQRAYTKAASPPVVYQDLLQLPRSMTLRFNATCVAGSDGMVLLIGGVNARTGEALASVAQFDTATLSFVEGVWALEEPVITPAAAADNGLLFLSGGFSLLEDPSLFNPTRKTRVYHRSVAVVDTQNGVYDAHVARYASEETASGFLRWTSPQLFVHGPTLLMLGSSSDAAAYRRMAYWMNMQLPLRKAQGMDTVRDTGENNTDAEMHFVDFAFTPARSDAVVAMVPGVDGRTLTFLLLGGRVPPSEGGGDYVADPHLFMATLSLCPSTAVAAAPVVAVRASALTSTRSNSGEARRSAVTTGVTIPPNKKRVTATAAVHALPPQVLGFVYQRVMNGVSSTALTPSRPPGAEPVPNQLGNTTVRINGYEPLWYNISFSILLSKAEMLQSCPGLRGRQEPLVANRAPASLSSYSVCSVMLSASPHCDASLAEYRFLSAVNTRDVTVRSVLRQGKDVEVEEAIAVGQTLLIGSPEHGLQQVLLTGADGRTDGAGSHDGDIAGVVTEMPLPLSARVPLRSESIAPSHDSATAVGFVGLPRHTLSHPHNSATPAVAAGALADTSENNTLLYEQQFLYVCFSRAPSVVAHCRPTASTEANDAITLLTRAKPLPPEHYRQQQQLPKETISTPSSACHSLFYVPLHPTTPLLLSSETTWMPSEDGEDDPPTPSGHPSKTGALVPSRLLLAAGAMVLVASVGFALYSCRIAAQKAPRRVLNRLLGHQDSFLTAGDLHERYRRRLLPCRDLGLLRDGMGAADGNVSGLREAYSVVLTASPIGSTSGPSPFGMRSVTAAPHRVLDGKYEIVRKLGKGSFSVVYLVRRVADGRHFALKYVQCSDDVDRHEAVKECEVVYALQGHPSVIQLVDMFMSYRFDQDMVIVPVPRITSKRDGERSKAAAETGAQSSGEEEEAGEATGSADATHECTHDDTMSTLTPARKEGEGAAAERLSVMHSDQKTCREDAQQPDVSSPAAESGVATASTPLQPRQRVVVRVDSAYLDALEVNEEGREGSTAPPEPQRPRGASAAPAHCQPALQAERYLSLVMAYHERGDLARWVRQRRALKPFIPEATIVSIAFQVLSLLSFMHHRHRPPIIHRDLKPENILLTTHVHYENVNDLFLPIVVTDFGLSRVMDKTFCETGVGSLPYVAPECWQRRYSTKVDIWALGCVLYAVCSKRVDSRDVRVMFSECAQEDFHERLCDEIVHVHGYSPALASFITALLAVKPERRPTAAEALGMLRRPGTRPDGVPLVKGGGSLPLAALLRPTASQSGHSPLPSSSSASSLSNAAPAHPPQGAPSPSPLTPAVLSSSPLLQNEESPAI